MKIVYSWLRDFVDVSASPKDLRERLSLAGISIDSIEEFPAGPVLDAEITANRPDCLGHYGMAREVAAIYRLPVKSPLPKLNESSATVASATRVEIDFAPFFDAARMLYEGPWLAERYAAVGRFMDANPGALFPVTEQIIAGGKHASAADAHEAAYKLKTLQRAAAAAWAQADFIVTPTAGTIYTIAAIAADPIRLNANLGHYTNFMNLFDLAGVAVPAGFRADGLPFGVTLVGPASSERALLAPADALHRASVSTLGATQLRLPPPSTAAAPLAVGYAALAVCGAHMEDLPLNPQLRDRGAYLVQRTRTAADYRLFALPGGPPERPGLIRVPAGGAPIEVEVWALPVEQLGSFVTGIPAPLGIGRVKLLDGSEVSGFICEGLAAAGAADITRFGSWRAYLASIAH